MSGWNASSRPTWDPQDGPGENTQAFPAPDLSEGADDGWPEPGAPPPGSGYGERQQPDDLRVGRRPARHRAGGLPQDAAPGGPPPDIFQQDPGYPDTAQRDYGQRGYGRPDLGPRDRAEPGHDREPYAREAYGRGGYRTAQPDNAQRDVAQRDYAGRDYVGRDHLDPDSAARMDPALQDFFAPQPPRPDAAQPGSGRQRHGMRGGHPDQRGGTGAGQAGGPARSGQPGQPGRPGQSGRSGRADPWDVPAARPGTRSASPDTRSARRAGHRPARRGLATAGIAVGLVVALGIAAVAVMLTRGKSGTPTAAGPTATPTAAARPQPTPSASKKAATGKPGAQPAGYTLTTPATAGGYPRLAQAPAAVQGTAAQTALTVFRTATNTTGSGKLPSDLTAAYQLSGGQVMTFAGYQGSFDPAKVMANLATLGTNGQPYDPGPHAGKLACATAPGTPSGTVCVWVTTTTLGITEFFSSVGPEVVTIQSKAATDTVRLRDGVEVLRS